MKKKGQQEEQTVKGRLLQDFDDYARAKKTSAITVRAILLFAFAVIVVALWFCYRMVSKASSTILVVDQTGQALKVSPGYLDKLMRTQLEAHCGSVAYYANTFDRLTITENQARTVFLMNKADAYRVFARYKDQRAYSDAIDRNLEYRCRLLEVTEVQQIQDFQRIKFQALLQILDNSEPIKEFIIHGEGDARRSTPQYPENTAGWYFSRYTQTWEAKKIDRE